MAPSNPTKMRLYNWFYSQVERFYHIKISAYGLGLFRITFFSVMLFEVITLFQYRHLIYDEIPYLQPYELNLSYPHFFWMIALVCVIVGIKTRIAALVNYFLSLALIGTIGSYEYHMFYAYMGVSFFAIIMPMERALSIDALVSKYKRLVKGKPIGIPKTSVLSYTILLFVGVGLVYFDSIFHKLQSFHWMNGLGVWYPSSIPQIVIRDFTQVLNMKYLMLFLGYLVVLFEAAFIFTFWFKPVRIPYLLIGIGLHMGIYLVYPIPYFALGVTAMYILLVPVGFWNRFFWRKSDLIP